MTAPDLTPADPDEDLAAELDDPPAEATGDQADDGACPARDEPAAPA